MTDFEIVGVVGDIRRAALTDRAARGHVFSVRRPRRTLFIQTTGDPLAALPAVRTALRTVEPAVVVHGARTFDDIASASMAITRLAMRLLAGFAIVALLLAAIGIYGVMAYSVRRRTREIGTRVALGADRGAIIRLVMREGGVITGAGVADRTGRRVAGGAIALRCSLWRPAHRSCVAGDGGDRAGDHGHGRLLCPRTTRRTHRSGADAHNRIGTNGFQGSKGFQRVPGHRSEYGSASRTLERR